MYTTKFPPDKILIEKRGLLPYFSSEPLLNSERLAFSFRLVQCITLPQAFFVVSNIMAAGKNIFIVAGEASGDLYGADLAREVFRIAPQTSISCIGGNLMEEAGCKCLFNIVDHAVMWFQKAHREFIEIYHIYKQTVRHLKKNRPDAVVLIDYPTFNLFLARKIKKMGIPIVYYVSPQIWAWGGWRKNKIIDRVDKMLVILPFETKIYKKLGDDVKYVGHPVFDHLGSAELDEGFSESAKLDKDDCVVGLLPGSRVVEIEKNFPVMLKAAEVIHRRMPSAKFLVPCSKEKHTELVRTIVAGSTLPIHVCNGKAFEVMKAAKLCLVTSGTATLQLAYYETPMVVMYRIVPWGRFFTRVFVRTPFISLVNILMGREVVPEHFLHNDEHRGVAASALKLLCDEGAWQRCVDGLRELNRDVAIPGASRRAAEALFATMDGRKKMGVPA